VVDVAPCTDERARPRTRRRSILVPDPGGCSGTGGLVEHRPLLYKPVLVIYSASALGCGLIVLTSLAVIPTATILRRQRERSHPGDAVPGRARPAA
jgi:hypothetical protein